jgi:hypothetical protein
MKKIIYLLLIFIAACTFGTTNKVVVNQYGESDSTKSNNSSIYILKDTIKTKAK